MKRDESVFPIQTFEGGNDPIFGLTVRDYIAIKAMQGLLANNESDTSIKTIQDWHKHISKVAYGYADAMIAESEKTQ